MAACRAEASGASSWEQEPRADEETLGQLSDFEMVLACRLRELQRQLVEDFRHAALERSQCRDARSARRPSIGSIAAAVLDPGIAAQKPVRCSAGAASLSQRTDLLGEASGGDSRGLLGSEAHESVMGTFASELCQEAQGVEGEDEATRPTPAACVPREFFMDEGRRGGSKHSSTHLRLGSLGSSESSEFFGNWMSMQSKCVVPPNSTFLAAFQLARVVAVSYDAVMMPWIVAWAPSWVGYKVASAVLFAFWVSDMILSFFLGYYSNGEAVTQHRRIALHYLRGWFGVDLAINLADSAVVLAELLPATDDAGGMLVAVAVLRLFRLFRILKVSISIPSVCAMRMTRDRRCRGALASSLQSIGLGAKLVLTLLWLNHLTCCLWFFIGKNGASDTGHSWLDTLPPSLTISYRDTSRLFQYTTSLHWSMTQMTPGSIQLVPQNSLEATFNVCCLFIGLFAGALLVSQLSARIVKVKLETQEQSARLAKLQTYLREHEVSWHLRDRVLDQIQHRLASVSRLTVKDVDLLGHLSLSLRRELNLECFGQHIMSHTLFHAWGSQDPALLRAICLHAVEMICLAKDDDVFTSNTVPDKMYLVLKGTLQYSLDMATDLASGVKSTTVREGAWVSEAALWLECSYSGTLTCRTQCELLAIDVPALLSLLKKFPRVRAVSHHYCVAFHKLFTTSHPEEHCDLGVSGEQLLMSMPIDWRLEVMMWLFPADAGFGGGPGLRMMGRRRSTGALNDDLQVEMKSGKAVVSLINGRLTRTVLLVTLRIENERTGQFLVRLAKKEDGRFIAAAALPGTKIRQGETAQQAVARMLGNDLFFFREQLDMHGSITSSKTAFSQKFKVHSKYMICTFNATVASVGSTALVASGGGTALTPGSQRGHVPLFKGGGRLASLGGLAVEDAADRAALANCQAFLSVNAEQELALYAWMGEELFARMKTVSGQESLQAWVTSNANRFPERDDTGDGRASDTVMIAASEKTDSSDKKVICI